MMLLMSLMSLIVSALRKSMSKPDVIWLMVTKDKYELPILVADSAVELAGMLGCTPNNIYSSVSHAKHRRQNSPYRRVEIDED